MIKDIAIYGAGGFGKEVACLIGRINKAGGSPKWNLIGFFDDGKAKGTSVSHFGTVLGGLSELNSWPVPLAVAIAIGKPSCIYSIKSRITNYLITYPNLIDKSFHILDPETFQIGQGNIIQGPGSISCDTRLGSFNILNGSIVIGHDSSIGNFNVLMPATRISGEVSLGDKNLLGIQSIVLQQVHVGDNVTLGPGSVLLSKPKDNSVYIGVPAKRFRY